LLELANLGFELRNASLEPLNVHFVIIPVNAVTSDDHLLKVSLIVDDFVDKQSEDVALENKLCEALACVGEIPPELFDEARHVGGH